MTRPGPGRRTVCRRGEAARQRTAPRALRLAVAILVPILALSGCGSISDKFRTAASQMPAIGLPAGAPERTAEPVPYPAVHDMPAPRNSTPLNVTEQEQMQRELATARDGQQTSAGLETQTKKKAKAAAAKAALPKSAQGATIY
jgi:uncharacterized protein YceK